MRTRSKRIAIGFGAALIALIALVVVLAIDGAMYERWKGAQELKILYQRWSKEGRPEPSSWQPAKAEAWHGAYSVDNRTYTTRAVNVTSLFNYADDHRKHPLFITADGSIFVIKDNKTARPLWQHETRAAAW